MTKLSDEAKAKRNEYARKYREKNREKVAEYNRRYWEKVAREEKEDKQA